MINYSETSLRHVAAHVVGNGVNGEKLKLSSEPLELHDEGAQELLITYFLSNFSSPEYYHFSAPEDQFTENPLFTIAAAIFSHPQSFQKNSIQIAQHLYAVTLLPNIKPGDVYMAYLSDVLIENERFDAIGIFKAERKDSFLKLNTAQTTFKVKADSGVNVQRLDKACLILNVARDSGYKILAVDNLNKTEADFWMNDFLQIKPRTDNFYHTRNIMNLTRQYVDEQLDEEFKVSKADKIDYLNRSMNFFKSKDQFKHHEFEAEVLEDPSVIESFRQYERTHAAASENDVVDNFEISSQAVKKQIRVFKSVLKLDKNFHIYIHGNRQLIEKGFDAETNKHYYKIYFDQET